MINTIVISVLPNKLIVMYVIHDNVIYPLLLNDDIVDKVKINVDLNDLTIIRDTMVSELGNKFYTMHYCLMVNGEIVNYLTYDEELQESEVA